MNNINLSRRSFLQKATAASLFCLSADLYAQYEARAEENGNDVVLRFSALSDVHFKKSPEAAECDRFRRSMRFMYDYSSKQTYDKFDAMLVAGDFSDHGWDEELLLFKKIMDEEIKDGTQTVLCMGNHEFIAGTKARWEEIFERPSNKVYEVNGFRFVALSPEKGSCCGGDYFYARDWFEQEVAKDCEADPNKPVFTFQHYHISPTVYGSRGDDDWGTGDLFEVLQKYPRVIDFSGHSHYPINDPRSAWQGRFTAFGTGTLSYFEMGGEGGKYNKFPQGYTNAAEMYVVEVRRDNSVALKPYDLITESFFDVAYVVAKPGDVENYLYTDARYQTSAKPEWKNGDEIICEDVDDSSATLVFPQAECPDVVHSYRTDLKQKVVEENGETSWKDAGSQYFWSEYYFKNRPDTMRATLNNLQPESTYRVEVAALNPFFKESDCKLTAELTTQKSPLDPADKDAPNPTANIINFDGRFADVEGEIVDNGRAIEVFGAPKFIKDDDLNANVAIFDGRNDRFRIKFDQKTYNRLSNATIAAKFKFDEFPQTFGDVFANTQGNGIAFEINGERRVLELWAAIDGTYKILSAPIETNRYIDAFGTFDGKNLILYVDGKEVARLEARGRLTHPTEEGVRAFCIGSDIEVNGLGAAHFKGRIASARLYSWALTAEQVKNLSK